MTAQLGRVMMTSVALWTAVVSTAAVPKPSALQRVRETREDISQYLPPGNGKALVAKECTACHEPGGMIRLRASKPKWEAVVIDMVARGAPLSIDDADIIIDYLSDVFGPQAPPHVDINTATRDELLKLPGVTPAAADRLVAHRNKKGASLTNDEVREAIGLDAAAFDKVRWYISGQQRPPAVRR